MKFDISSLLVKSKEHDSKIEDIVNTNTKFVTKIKNIENNINNSDTKIKNIENSNSKNNKNINKLNHNFAIYAANITKQIDNIKNVIPSITKNTSNISENLRLINTKSDIIDNNKNNITNNYNITQINKKKSEFDTLLIDNSTENIKSIKNDIDNYYKLKDIIIFDIEKSNIPEDIKINTPIFSFIQSSLNNNFRKDSYLEFDSSILILLNKHYINIGFFHFCLEIFDDENVLFKSIKMSFNGTISKFCNITNNCIVKIPDNYDKIYFKLLIS